MSTRSTRYGITFWGLLWAGGAGVFLGAVPIGYVVMVATAFANSPMIGALPGALGLGALAGLAVAYATRRTIHPKMPHRRRRFVVTGMVTMPGYLFLGQFPNLTTDPTAPQWAVGFILCCGVAGIVVYYQWRKRVALQRHARQAATHAGRQQPTTH